MNSVRLFGPAIVALLLPPRLNAAETIELENVARQVGRAVLSSTKRAVLEPA